MRPGWWRAAVPLGVGLALALAPVPAGLERHAWTYFALFAAVVVGLILEPIPAAAIGLVGVTVAGVGRLVERSPTWTQWLAGFWPVGVPLFALVPLLVYVLHPPEIRTSGEVPAWAARELATMGPMSGSEKTMAALVLLAVLLWIVGSNPDVALPLLGSQFVDATGVVLLANALMLVTGVVGWDDVLSSKAAWNVLVWFATLVALADGLSRVGFVAWVARALAARLGGFPPLAAMAALVVFFFLVHYMFASLTAHAAAVLPVVLATGMAVPGLPVKPFALLLVYSLGLMGVLSPYATGPAPVYYASGYVSRRDFWVLGLVFGAIYLLTLLAIGIPYLTVAGPLE